MSLTIIDFNLKDLLQGIKAAQGIKAQEKEVKMKLRWDDDVPEMVVGDPVRLGQIINNLTSNAVKFTSKGQVAIEVELKEETADQVIIGFEVSDTGIGIPEDKLATIFDEFSQASSSITRQFGGTGLGLAITKKLLELQDSEIQVTSREGEGSSFFFTLGFGKSVKKVVQRGSSAVESSGEYLGNLQGAQVLLVEDNPINQYVAARFLKKWQIKLDTANNGAEALEKIQQKEYDLVLMDLQMPVVDGVQATKNIRAWQAAHQKAPIPIIALTASATQSTQDRVISAGMNDFVTKPFVPKELFARLQHHLTPKLDGKADQLSTSGDPVKVNEPSVEEKQVINTSTLEQMTDGDPVALKRICDEYEGIIQQLVIDLQVFQKHRDPVQLGQSVHHVKAAFIVFGAESLSQLLEQVSISEGEAQMRLVEETLQNCYRLQEVLANYRRGLDTDSSFYI